MPETWSIFSTSWTEQTLLKNSDWWCNHYGTIALLSRLLLFLAFPLSLSAQQLTSLAAVYQGELFTAILYPYNKGKSVSFRLLSDQGIEQSSNLGFGYDPDSDSLMRKGVGYNPRHTVWVGILAVASDLTPGVYLLQVEALTQRGTLTLQSQIQVLPTSFPSYQLRLSKRMQNLIGEPSARAKAESSERWNLIKEADRDMLYHTGRLRIPVEHGRVTSPFGERRSYIYPDHRTSQSIHRGYDFAAPRGTPVFSSSSGKVVLAKNRRVTGKTIIVAVLPGLFLQYQHLDSIAVSLGNWVHEGQRIGTVGSTGFATGPHLHQELYVKGVTVDPSIYYKRPLLDKNLILSMIGASPS